MAAKRTFGLCGPIPDGRKTDLRPLRPNTRWFEKRPSAFAPIYGLSSFQEKKMHSKILVTLLAVTLWGGSKSPAPAANQQATVTLKDGSTFSGAVTKNSTSEISLQAPTGESRTYPLSQVASVQFAQDQTAPPPANQAANTPPP